MDNELISKAAAIMKVAETAVIALIDDNGFPKELDLREIPL